MKALWITAAVASIVVGLCLGTGCSKKQQTSEEKTSKSAPSAGAPAASPAHGMMPPASSPKSATSAPAGMGATMPTTQGALAAVAAAAKPIITSPEMEKMHETFGLVVTDVKVNGPVVEVEFFVEQPDKAGTITSPAAERYIIDQKSGTKLLVPGTGSSAPERTRRPTLLKPVFGQVGAQRSYIATFDNSEGLVKPGDKVTLVMAEYRVTDLAVR